MFQGRRFQLRDGKVLVSDAELFLISIPDIFGRRSRKVIARYQDIGSKLFKIDTGDLSQTRSDLAIDIRRRRSTQNKRVRDNTAQQNGGDARRQFDILLKEIGSHDCTRRTDGPTFDANREASAACPDGSTDPSSLS